MHNQPKNINQWTQKEFLSLPQRMWSKISQYSSIVIFPTGKMHDSEFGCLAIVGMNENCFPVELITTASDDIEWRIHQKSTEIQFGTIRTECLFESGALHFWSKCGYFEVSEALSSITIEFFRTLTD